MWYIYPLFMAHFRGYYQIQIKEFKWKCHRRLSNSAAVSPFWRTITNDTANRRTLIPRPRTTLSSAWTLTPTKISRQTSRTPIRSSLDKHRVRAGELAAILELALLTSWQRQDRNSLLRTTTTCITIITTKMGKVIVRLRLSAPQPPFWSNRAVIWAKRRSFLALLPRTWTDQGSWMCPPSHKEVCIAIPITITNNLEVERTSTSRSSSKVRCNITIIMDMAYRWHHSRQS